MVSQAVGELMGPLNAFVFQCIPFILALLAFFAVLTAVRKLIDVFVYRRHKHDVLVSTNKWWSWEDYKNGKKEKNDGT